MTECGNSAGTTVSPPAAFELCRLQLNDLPECIDIAHRSFEHFAGDADAVRNWFNARITHNPWQAALNGVGIGVRNGSRLIAFRAMFAQPWWIDGKATTFAFAAHTCIEPAHRGGGAGQPVDRGESRFLRPYR